MVIEYHTSKTVHPQHDEHVTAYYVAKLIEEMDRSGFAIVKV